MKSFGHPKTSNSEENAMLHGKPIGQKQCGHIPSAGRKGVIGPELILFVNKNDTHAYYTRECGYVLCTPITHRISTLEQLRESYFHSRHICVLKVFSIAQNLLTVKKKYVNKMSKNATNEHVPDAFSCWLILSTSLGLATVSLPHGKRK